MGRLFRQGVPLGRLQPQAVDQLGKLKPQTKSVQLPLLHRLTQRVLRLKGNRGIPVNGCQVVGHSGVSLPFGQLFHHGRFGRCIKGLADIRHLLIHAVNGAIDLDQPYGRLFSDPLYPRDIIAAIPHQCL